MGMEKRLLLRLPQCPIECGRMRVALGSGGVCFYWTDMEVMRAWSQRVLRAIVRSGPDRYRSVGRTF